MKKAILVTWFNFGRNYGQTLQAFALQSKLRELNIDALLLNYGFGVYSSNRLLNYLKRRKHIRGKDWHLQKKFDHFVRKNLRITKLLGNTYDMHKYLKEYNPEILVCGSDQIWNPYNAADYYYLYNLVENDAKKMAYAASMCSYERKSKFAEFKDIKLWLDDFDYISVRERSGAQILNEMFDINSEVVLDPTLLFTGKEWIEKLNLKKNNDEKYILCYSFNLSECQKQFIKMRAEKNNLKVIYGNILLDNSQKSLWTIEDFLNAIYNAEEVITDSFHGTAFSILFNKQVFVFDNGKDEDSDPYYNIDRMETLLTKLNLKNQIINESNISNEFNLIDYSSVNDILEAERKKSILFLKKISN